MEGFLKALTQQPKVFSYSDSDGDLMLWVVKVADSQVKAIQGNEELLKSIGTLLLVRRMPSFPYQPSPQTRPTILWASLIPKIGSHVNMLFCPTIWRATMRQ